MALALSLTAACGSDDEDADVQASGDSVDCSQILDGETVTFAVDKSPGGGYDTEARLLAPYIEERTGATVVVRNETGAGGTLAANNTANARSGGDVRIQHVDMVGAMGAQLGEYQGVAYDLNNFHWLARLNAEPRVLIAAPDSDITFEDVLSPEGPTPKFGLTGPGAHEFITFETLQYGYQFKAEPISGYDGRSEFTTALLRGDVDTAIVSLGQAVEDIESGELRGILQYSDESSDLIPDVPALGDFPLPDPSRGTAIEALSNLFEASRSIAAAPNTDPAVVSCLREIVFDILESEEFKAEAVEREVALDPLPGSELQDLVAEILEGAPEEFREIIRTE